MRRRHNSNPARKTTVANATFLRLNNGEIPMYADILDEAAAREQQLIEVALANRKAPEPPSPVCKNADCGEPSQPGTSYCTAECREDDEKWQRAIQQRRVA